MRPSLISLPWLHCAKQMPWAVGPGRGERPAWCVVSGKVPSPQPGLSASGSLADLISPVFMHQKGQVLILPQSLFSMPRPDRGEKG